MTTSENDHERITTLKIPFQKRTTIGAIEEEISKLAKSRVDIEFRISENAKSLETAKAERREFLVDDGDIGSATKRIRDLNAAAEDLAGLLVDIDAQGEDAVGRLTKARDEAARATSAAALEKIALAAELRCPELDKAIATVARAAKALLADLDAEIGLWESHNSNRPLGSIDIGRTQATSREAVSAVVADGLATALPWLFDRGMDADGYRSSLSRVMDPTSTQPDWVSNSPTDPRTVCD